MKKKIILLLGALLIVLLLSGQIINESFETDGQASLNGWNIFPSNIFADSYQDAPQNGGNWCLMLESGNTQGTFPVFAYQIIPDIQNTDICNASCWIKREFEYSQGSIYFKIFKADGSSVNLDMATTDSFDWTNVSIQDTIYLEEGDSVAIVLDSGITSANLTNHIYFDLVNVEKINDFHDKTLDIPLSNLLQNYPNPFNPTTTISYVLPQNTKNAGIEIYNFKGQKVRNLDVKSEKLGLNSVVWDGKDNNNQSVSSGVYFYRLNMNGKAKAVRKCVLMK